MWYRDKAYNLGYRHQMGIIIEKERYKVVGRPMYTRIAISKIISPRNWNKLRIRKHPSKSRKELEKLYIIHYIKGLEKDISLYVSWNYICCKQKKKEPQRGASNVSHPHIQFAELQTTKPFLPSFYSNPMFMPGAW
ncbi:hypothetical protein C2G38_2047418 [Gigaspora rosea]|uniref:Uncharacterized protein n=1 Tax=Gigaspora rosea TaxID=44941 RepID=A0A397U5X5_9GLOM|nr:hypothetical protein C2G38_2047418 [Gigaspora rosea]